MIKIFNFRWFAFFAIFAFSLYCKKVELPKAPIAIAGTIDFANWDFEDGSTPLNGEWIFFHNQYLENEDLLNAWKKHSDFGFLSTLNGQIVPIPEEWNAYQKPNSLELVGSNAYATYLLGVKNLPRFAELGIEIKEEGTSYELSTCFLEPVPFCKTIASNGVPGTNRENTIPQILNYLGRLDINYSDILFVFKIANFHHRQGGFWESIILGKLSTLQKKIDYKNASSLISLGIILIMGLYHFGLVSQRREDKGSLYFALFCLSIALRTTIVDRIIHHYLIEPQTIHFEILYKLEYISIYLATPLFYSFFQSIFSEVFSRKFHYFLWIVSGIFVVQ